MALSRRIIPVLRNARHLRPQRQAPLLSRGGATLSSDSTVTPPPPTSNHPDSSSVLPQASSTTQLPPAARTRHQRRGGGGKGRRREALNDASSAHAQKTEKRKEDYNVDRGRKEVYLPNFTLTLLRTPFLPAKYATFIVPLHFNKLDLKSYLHNAYAVSVLSVRSYVQQQRVRQDKPSALRPKPRRWFRPRAIKKMTVEMTSPFVWPAEIEDYEPWGRDMFDRANQAREEERERMVKGAEPGKAGLPSPERGLLAQQAERLRRGLEPWRTGLETEDETERATHEGERVEWEDVGPAVEVEKNVRV